MQATTTTHHGHMAVLIFGIRTFIPMMKSATARTMNPASKSVAAPERALAAGRGVAWLQPFPAPRRPGFPGDGVRPRARPGGAVRGGNRLSGNSSARTLSANGLSGYGDRGRRLGVGWRAGTTLAFTSMVAEPPSLSTVTAPSCSLTVPVSTAT